MALTHTQSWIDDEKESKIFTEINRLISGKNRLVTIRTNLLSLSAAINADANANANLKTLATQIEGAMNNAKITEFISFIASNLE